MVIEQCEMIHPVLLCQLLRRSSRGRYAHYFHGFGRILSASVVNEFAVRRADWIVMVPTLLLILIFKQPAHFPKGISDKNRIGGRIRVLAVAVVVEINKTVIRT